MTNDSNPPDAEKDLVLLRAVAAGDRASIAELAQRLRCIPRFPRRIRGRISPAPDSSELADLSQDATLAVLEAIESFRGHGVLEAWVYRICKFTVWRGLRIRRRSITYDDPNIDELAEDSANAPGSDIELREFAGAMLDELGGREAEVVRLRCYESLEFHEIATRLEMAFSTVRSHYYRGIRRLRRIAGDQWELPA